MNSPKLPDIETARVMPFAKLAGALNGFLTDSNKNNISDNREEIDLLKSLVEILSLSAPVIPPHPGPKPIEPTPPRPPHYPYDLNLGWPYTIELSPKQQAYNENYPKYYSDYELQIKEWERNVLLPWEEAANQNYQVLNSIEHLIIKGIRKRIDKLLNDSGRLPITREVDWEILPPGYWPVDESSVENLFSGKSAKTLIPARLISAVALDPIEIIKGKNELNEYLCFRFSSSNKVLLESPYDGNAAYILSGDWESLSKKTKWELLNIYSDFCERIIHGQSGNWKYEIKRSLGIYR